MTRQRHRQGLQDCQEALQRYFDNEQMVELAAEELRLASRCIQRITGRVDVEQILDIVFRDFCIGK
jgi:tRNA modification GTPase